MAAVLSLPSIKAEYSFTPEQFIRTIGREVDFYDKNHNLIVEVDGPHHFIPIGDKEEYRISDKMTDEILKAAGFTVIRIKYTEIMNKNGDEVAYTIHNLFQEACLLGGEVDENPQERRIGEKCGGGSYNENAKHSHLEDDVHLSGSSAKEDGVQS